YGIRCSQEFFRDPAMAWSKYLQSPLFRVCFPSLPDPSDNSSSSAMTSSEFPYYIRFLGHIHHDPPSPFSSILNTQYKIHRDVIRNKNLWPLLFTCHSYSTFWAHVHNLYHGDVEKIK